jgi:hypothetical protein
MLTPAMFNSLGTQNFGNQNQSLSSGNSVGGLQQIMQQVEQQLGQIEQQISQEIQQLVQQLQQELGGLGSGSQSGAGSGGLGSTGGSSDPFSGLGSFGDAGSTGSTSGSQSPWTVTNTGAGQDQIDLGNYTLSLNKSDSGWTLTNKQTGATTNISGDPHVSENGNNWTFKNDLTFALDDGTKITVHTTPAGNGQTLSSSLDITKNGYGMQVTGLASNDGNQLQVADGLNGYAMDSSNSNIPMLFEDGNNWDSLGVQTVDASFASQNL